MPSTRRDLAPSNSPSVPTTLVDTPDAGVSLRVARPLTRRAVAAAAAVPQTAMMGSERSSSVGSRGISRSSMPASSRAPSLVVPRSRISDSVTAGRTASSMATRVPQLDPDAMASPVQVDATERGLNLDGTHLDELAIEQAILGASSMS